MPFHAATQPQLEELERSLKTLHQAIERSAQGEFPAPLKPERRSRYANLSLVLVQALEALDVVVSGPSLGPNDIVVDSSQPITVRDNDTGVTGSTHIDIENGTTIVGFTSEEISLVKAGTTVQARDKSNKNHNGLILSGIPLRADFGENIVAAKDGQCAIQIGAAGTSFMVQKFNGYTPSNGFYANLPRVQLDPNVAITSDGKSLNLWNYNSTVNMGEQIRLVVQDNAVVRCTTPGHLAVIPNQKVFDLEVDGVQMRVRAYVSGNELLRLDGAP